MPTPFDEIDAEKPRPKARPTPREDTPRRPPSRREEDEEADIEDRYRRRRREREDEEEYRDDDSREFDRGRRSQRESAGVYPKHRVRMVSFVILTCCLLLSGVIITLSIWGIAGETGVWRSIATIAVLAFMTIGFTILNEVFGKSVKHDRHD